jgi:hypothetical protein
MIAHLFRIVSMLILSIASAFSWGADNSQHKAECGIYVYFCVVPAKVVQAQVKQLALESTHEKTRLAPGTHDLVVSLYDAKILDLTPSAAVSAAVTQLGLSQETKTLDLMKINNMVSYGNYFNMPFDDTRYRITLEIKRSTDHIPVSVAFEDRHGVMR